MMVMNSIEQSPPTEAANSSASSELSRSVWHPTIHYRADKSLPLVFTLNLISPIHTVAYCLFKLQLTEHLMYAYDFKLGPFLRVFPLNSTHFPLPMHAKFTIHPVLLHIIALITLSEKFGLRNASFLNFSWHCIVTSCLFETLTLVTPT